MASIGMLSIEDQTQIESHLKDFLVKAESRWAALVDRGGNLFAEQGQTGSLDMTILCALAAGSFSATRELAKRLGEGEFSALYHEGHGVSILMTALEHECLLVTVFSGDTNIGLVRFYSQQTAPHLNHVLQRASEAPEQSLLIEASLHDGGSIIS
ncbi:MAG: roadblock/LC7 domain-containing protein [Candidatus Methylacidiphilales bacterium]